MAHSHANHVIVVLPVFNDWHSLSLLLPQLDSTLAAHDISAEVMIVDDASTVEPTASILPGRLDALATVGVLRLRRNLGHQRAIAISLAFLEQHREPALVVVMDGDGEDQPADVPRLISQCRAADCVPIVFAERVKRSESLLFRICYRVFRVVHLILTGHRVRVGNFSVLPWSALSSLVSVSEMWNHYAAAVVKVRIPWTTIPTTRGKRLAGNPTMNFTALVVHGLSALAVFGDTVGIRLLIAASGLVGTVIAALLVVVTVRLGTSVTIPGWTTYTAGFLLLALLQVFLAGFIVTVAILANRAAFTFVPLRDYRCFVQEYRVITRG